MKQNYLTRQSYLVRQYSKSASILKNFSVYWVGIAISSNSRVGPYDYLSAWKCVERTKENLKTIELPEIACSAERFVEKAKEVFESIDDYSDLSDMLVAELPVRRVSRKKRMPEEVVADEPMNVSLVHGKREDHL